MPFRQPDPLEHCALSVQVPTPLSGTVAEPPGEALTISEAVLLPMLAGLKVTTTLQVAPPASAPAQVVDPAEIRN
jgi:hypothetical protein